MPLGKSKKKIMDLFNKISLSEPLGKTISRHYNLPGICSKGNFNFGL